MDYNMKKEKYDELLLLQEKYENGEISEADLSIEELDLLNKLYDILADSEEYCELCERNDRLFFKTTPPHGSTKGYVDYINLIPVNPIKERSYVDTN